MHHAAIVEERIIEEHQQEEAIWEEEIEELKEITEEMDIKVIFGNAEYVIQVGITILSAAHFLLSLFLEEVMQLEFQTQYASCA